MNNIQLILSDIDGTLLNERGVLTERTIAAIHAVQAAGARFALASGRMAHAMLDYARALDLSAPLIAFNGAQLTDPATLNPVISHPVPAALAREVCRFAADHHLHAQSYRGSHVLIQEENDWAHDYIRDMNSKEISLEAVGVPLYEYLEEDVPKVLVIDKPERIEQILPIAQEHFAGRLVCTTSRARYLEFIVPEANKGQALYDLCAHLNIPIEQTAAFGDGLNDLPMLEAAAFGCAVSNAKDTVRQRVAHIAPSNREDGVAQMLESLLEQGLIGKGV